MKTKEIWKAIPNSDGKYEISNRGRIRRGEKIRKLCSGGNIYYTFAFIKKSQRYTYYVHRLVAQLFVPNPENKIQVNHKNSNKIDNRAENLEWVTNKENAIHHWNSPYCKISPNRAKGEKVNTSKLFAQEVIEIRDLFKTGKYGLRELGRKYNVTDTAIKYIIIRKNWKHI